VNRQVTRVAWTAMALIVALILGTTYWQTWARPGLAARQDNEIQRVAEFQVRRGLILAPGRVLARNRAVKRNGKTLYFRRYPQGKLTANVVGYSTAARSRAISSGVRGTVSIIGRTSMPSAPPFTSFTLRAARLRMLWRTAVGSSSI